MAQRRRARSQERLRRLLDDTSGPPTEDTLRRLMLLLA